MIQVYPIQKFAIVEISLSGWWLGWNNKSSTEDVDAAQHVGALAFVDDYFCVLTWPTMISMITTKKCPK